MIWYICGWKQPKIDKKKCAYHFTKHNYNWFNFQNLIQGQLTHYHSIYFWFTSSLQESQLMFILQTSYSLASSCWVGVKDYIFNSKEYLQSSHLSFVLSLEGGFLYTLLSFPIKSTSIVTIFVLSVVLILTRSSFAASNFFTVLVACQNPSLDEKWCNHFLISCVQKNFFLPCLPQPLPLFLLPTQFFSLLVVENGKKSINISFTQMLSGGFNIKIQIELRLIKAKRLLLIQPWYMLRLF